MVTTKNDNKTLAVANVGQSEMKSLTDADGVQAQMTNSVTQIAFGYGPLDLMTVDRSTWTDPDLRDWTPGDAIHFDFEWSG